MDRTKLMQNPLPVDRVAARVVRKAKAEDVWRPVPKEVAHIAGSVNFLATAAIPRAALCANPELIGLIGKRRSRMVVVGYAAEQGSQNKSARWVVRCDCGNYEHRTSVFRWLGTDAPDMCRECRQRNYKIRGEFFPTDPAHRETVEQARKQEST